MSETDKKYLTPNEVGHRLGIHRNTVTAMIKDGRFPGSFVIGTRWRVPESAYDSSSETKVSRQRKTKNL